MRDGSASRDLGRQPSLNLISRFQVTKIIKGSGYNLSAIVGCHQLADRSAIISAAAPRVLINSRSKLKYPVLYDAAVFHDEYTSSRDLLIGNVSKSCWSPSF